ncbi:MAG: PAS domain S-box protein [Desmonostoc vinosum HA7617-LM4]|jgi:diguanylate cyclase (GGDEF)-like protein/PAS domain S-box-containing protein|nr:PAS domain S-box protein [Desmonostoc vinosum HA7617-LM4]
MNTITEKLLVPDDTEYLAVTCDLLITEISSNVQRFADYPNEVILGKDIRLGFPELVGIEYYLLDILEGRQKKFKLKGIARFNEPHSPFYLDLYITSFDGLLILLLQDATERMILAQHLVHKHNEANLLLNALSISNNYLDKILKSLKDVLLITNLSGYIIKANPAANILFEYDLEELINQPISMIIHDKNILLEIYQHNPSSQTDFLNNCSVICQTKTGKNLTVAFCISVIETEIEGLQHFVYIGRDITERKQAENALKESEERFRSMANCAPVLLWMTDTEGLCTYVNQPWLRFTGRTLEQELGSGWMESIPTDDFQRCQALFQRALTARESILMEHRLRHHTGEYRWILVSGTPRFVGEEFVGCIGSCVDITERKLTEAALLESEERFQAFMNNSPAVAFMKDSWGHYVYINNTFEGNFNVQLADLQGKTDFDWLPEETAKQVSENDFHVISTGETVQVIETVPTLDGCLHHWLVFKFPFRDGQQRHLVGGVAFDISDRLLLEQQLFEEKELAQVTLQSIGDAVITTNASGQIKYLNPVAEKLTGWKLRDAQGNSITRVFKVVNEITHEPVENPVESVLRSGCTVSLAKDSILITRDGAELAVEDSAAPICDKNGQIIGAVMVFQDVSLKRNMARQLSWQATHDALTGLFNRREFERRLEEKLNDAKINNQQHALCYLDLDRFKIINDTCGHLVGDQLLRQVTILFQNTVRSADTVARLGGDEFGILLCGCLLESALIIANTIVQRIREFRFVWQDKTFKIGVSIGVVTIDANNHSINSILSAADAACYAAKNKGRDRVDVDLG